MEDPCVWEVVARGECCGVPLEPGDCITAWPGGAVQLVRDLPRNYGALLGAEAAGVLRLAIPCRPQLVVAPPRPEGDAPPEPTPPPALPAPPLRRVK